MNTNLLLDFNLKNYKSIVNKLLNSNSGINLYSGKSGAILYLIELYNQSNNHSILEEIINVEKLIKTELKSSVNQSYSFYSGNIGISFVYLQLYKVFRNEYYLKESIELAKKSKNQFIIEKKPVIDLLTGISGILLGLLHLWKEGVNESWLIDDIEFYIKYIISEIELIENTIAWGKNKKNIFYLTGFSHGSSGIGFVFFQLFKLTEIELFKKIAYLSFDYENLFYDKNSNNWLDLRVKSIDPSKIDVFIKSAEKENFNFFYEKKTMNAWCHGAPGILLSRLNTGYKEENFEQAFNTIVSSLKKKSNHSLCHSNIGNALCLMTISQFKETSFEQSILNEINEICVNLMNYYSKNNNFIDGYKNDYKYHSYSLMMGELGSLYFLLKANKFLNKQNIGENILFPYIGISVNKKNFKRKINLSNDYIFKELLKTKFPKTVSLINDDITFNSSEKILEEIEKFVKNTKNRIIKDSFFYEKSIYLNSKKVKNFFYSYYQNKAIEKKLNDIDKNDFLLIKVSINNNIDIIQTNNDWNEVTNPHWSLNNKTNKLSYKYGIVPRLNMQSYNINELSSLIIDYIKQFANISVKLVLINVMEKISVKKEQLELLQNIIINELKRLIYSSILIMNYEL